MSNHIGDTNKMVSDTPRLVDQILLSEKNDWTADLYRVGCDLQRELNAANERIKRLEEALTSIGEYCNRQTKERAMEDACWHAMIKAKEAKL